MDEPVAGNESSETTVAEQAPAMQATGGPGSNSAGPGSNSAVALPTSIWTWLLWLQFILLTGAWLSIVAIQDLPNSLDVIDVLFFGLLVWQCEALGFWMGLGRSRWRLLLVPAAAVALAVLCSIAAHGELLEFLVFVFGLVSVVGLTTLVLRFFAGTLARVTDNGGGNEALQFGIQNVMVWTLLLAVLFCLGRYVIPYAGSNNSVNGLAEIFVLAAGMSGATVVLVWALLGTNLQPARLAGMLIVMAGATLLTHYLSEWWPFTVSTVVAQLLLVTTLILLRMDRFRFLKHASRSPASGLHAGSK